MAIATPLIKKSGLDTVDMASYRLVSNLSFTTKTVEHIMAQQLNQYLLKNAMMLSLQSAYRHHHSTETVLLHVMSDIFAAADQQRVTLLAMLDLNMAFDCVDHDILLLRLECTFGLSGLVLGWIPSYLSERTQRVVHQGDISLLVRILWSEPQSSVLRSLLFLLYTAELFVVIEAYGATSQFYADCVTARQLMLRSPSANW